METKTSRRSLPALSLPAIALSAQTDPVFAFIARHQGAFAALQAVCDKHDDYEEQHGPIAGLGFQRDIRRELSNVEGTAWIVANAAKLKALEDRRSRRLAKTELGKLQIAIDRAHKVEREAAWNLIWTVPATPAGLATVLSYIQKQQQQLDIFDGGEWLEIFLYSAECATCAFAGLPEPPMTKAVSRFAADGEARAAAP